MTQAHAVLAPSAAPRWGNCSGSVAASAAAPNIDTPESRAGTAAHWVGAECLKVWQGGGCGASCVLWLGKTDPDGTVIDDKMCEGAQIWVDDAVEWARYNGTTADLLIEHRVQMPRVHAQNWGTLDTAVYTPCTGRLLIEDYKHGHRQHSAEGHLQLIDYVEGLVDEFSIPDDTEVTLRIVQPFCYTANGPIDSWTVRLSELRPYLGQLAAKAAEALTCPTMSAGPWCRDCPAVGRCATARASNYGFADYLNQPYQIDGMDSADLAAERQILIDSMTLGKSRLEAVEEQLRYNIGGGDASGGLLLETGYGRRAWTVEPSVAVAIGAQFGVDLGKPGAVTPTQAKTAAAGDEVLIAAIEQISKRPTTGLKLTPAGDTMTSRAFRSK